MLRLGIELEGKTLHFQLEKIVRGTNLYKGYRGATLTIHIKQIMN